MNQGVKGVYRDPKRFNKINFYIEAGGTGGNRDPKKVHNNEFL